MHGCGLEGADFHQLTKAYYVSWNMAQHRVLILPDRRVILMSEDEYKKYREAKQLTVATNKTFTLKEIMMPRKKTEKKAKTETPADLTPVDREVCSGCNKMVGFDKAAGTNGVILVDFTKKLPRMLCMDCSYITEIGTGASLKEMDLNTDIVAAANLLNI